MRAIPTVRLPDGMLIPALGQGTWNMGDVFTQRQSELAALRSGVDAGMTVIDTAEMYGNGRSEKLVGEAIKGIEREKLFIVSKVLPNNAGRANIFESCERSLRYLETPYLDLYLLHWRGGVPLKETVQCMEELVKSGKIKRWGVSNFDAADMEELWKVPNGNKCSINQVLYHIASRGTEYDLQPWMAAHKVPLMAYCPIAQAGDLHRGLYTNKVLKEIAEKHKATVTQVLLAFTIRSGNVVSIPKAGKPEHAKENAAAAGVTLSADELAQIDKEFPPPTRKVHLDII